MEIVVSLTAYAALIKFGYHLGKFLPFSEESDVSVTIKHEKPKIDNKFIVYAGVTAALLVLTFILTITDNDIRKVWLSCLLAPIGKI